MPRAPRRDTPGSWHHVMGRGIAKRTIFECREDFRYFESLLAREVRCGRLEVHAFALLMTHFHLLVRSPLGQLSLAMERVLRSYARWFNRRRRRDGALFKERFKSKPVDSDAYRSLLVRYIDDNPVKPGLAPHAAAYPFCSAFLYSRPEGPLWLERSWIEGEVKGVRGIARYEPRDYAERFPSRIPDSIAKWIEGRILSRNAPEDEFAELLAPHSKSQIDWMVRKALLADGTVPFELALPPALVEEEWARLREERPGWQYGIARERSALWPAMLAGLLRHSCALSHSEIRARIGVPESTTASRAQRHRLQLDADHDYAMRTALVIERVQRKLDSEAYPHRYRAEDAIDCRGAIDHRLRRSS